MGSSHECSLCGYCKAWSTCEAVTQTPCGCTLGSCVSACTLLTTAPEDVSRQSRDPIYSGKGRNGSHSIICKVTCCLLSLFLLHILFVFKCFRQSKNKCKSKDAVKTSCLVCPAPYVSSTAVNKMPVSSQIRDRVSASPPPLLPPPPRDCRAASVCRHPLRTQNIQLWIKMSWCRRPSWPSRQSDMMTWQPA